MFKPWPLLPLFSIACLVLTFLIWRLPDEFDQVDHKWLFGSAFLAMGFSGAIGLFARNFSIVAYDLFCLGALCVWFVLWREVYRIDAPVFKWYPVFFVLLCAALNYQVIHQSDRLDPLQVRLLVLIRSFKPFHPLILISGILLCIYFSAYYILFPIVFSFLLIRLCFDIVLIQLNNG